MSSPGNLTKNQGVEFQEMEFVTGSATYKPEEHFSMQCMEIGKSSSAFTPLIMMHQAAREGNVEQMRGLMKQISRRRVRRKRLNQRDESNMAPIHYAARYNHRDMIAYLIRHGARVQETIEDGATVLHVLAKHKQNSVSNSSAITENEKTRRENKKEREQRGCVKLLVENGAHVNAKNEAGQTPLHLSCARDNIRITKELLECTGLALEAVDNQGMTALHLACLNGHSNIVHLLVEAGADLRCRDKEMITPMHLACSEGSLEIAKILFHEAQKREIELSRSNSEESVEEPKSKRRASIAVLQQFTVFHKDMHTEMKTRMKDSAGGIVLMLDEDIAKSLPLHLAIENGHLSLVEFSIEKTKAAGHGSMVTSLQSNNNACLHLAVQANNIEIVKLLLEEGADINARNISLLTPLHLACQHNAYEIVKHLTESGCDIETKDTDHMTPFLVASRYGHLEILALLMEYNADVTATGKDDKTCLMLAAEENSADAIRMLMNHNKIKLFLEERSKYNDTALHLASLRGHSDTIKLLLDYQASAESKNDADQTALHMAALHGHHSIIPDLVNRDRSIINAGDDEANTALHLAAIGGKLKCVDTLIELGANLGLKNVKKWTALDCACAFGYLTSARILLLNGATIESSGKIKISALHLACQRGHVDVVNLLLKWKADVTFRSIDGRNALDYAIDFDRKGCVLSLIKHPKWLDSLKNAYIYPQTGRLITPMRKLIMKMEDMAEVVCNQCMGNNGKKPDDQGFKVTLNFELLDDVYSMGQWIGQSDTEARKRPVPDDEYKIYDESGHVTEEAFSYYDDAGIIQKNHPLMLMVKSKCGVLLKHPVVVGLLDYKWQRFGRYVYYTSLIFFLLYLFLLNMLMLIMPIYYEIDWVTMLHIRKIKAGLPITKTNHTIPVNDSLNCFYYRSDLFTLPSYAEETGCVIMYPLVVQLERAVLILSAISLLREGVQILVQRLAYLNVMNVVTVILYLMTLLLTLDFTPFELRHLEEVTKYHAHNSELKYLEMVEKETNLRQEWQQDIGSFSVFLAWMVLLLYIQKIPMFGIFVVMFTDVLKTFARFSIVLLLFILSFAITFNVLIGNQYFFHTFFWSIATTIAMTVGEINYATIFFSIKDLRFIKYFEMIYSKGICVIMLILLLIMMTIIIMNLLVGLAIGDILEVQENASLQRFRMQVDLALEVEFSLPEFLRKKLCLGKQSIQINKYRKANFFKKFLFENPSLALERISEYLSEKGVQKNYDLTNMEGMLVSLVGLRNQVNCVFFELSELEKELRHVQGKVYELQMEAKRNTKDIKVDIVSTSNELSERIEHGHSSQIETTHQESIQTRAEIDEATNLVVPVLEYVEGTRRQTTELLQATEKRVMLQQEAIAHQHWEHFESRVAEYNDCVEKGTRALLKGIDDFQKVCRKTNVPSRRLSKKIVRV